MEGLGPVRAAEWLLHVAVQANLKRVGLYAEAYSVAAHSGHVRILQALLEEGGTIQIPTGFRYKNGRCGVHAYVQALCDAAGAGHTRIMRALMEEGGTALSGRALVVAAHAGKREAARRLVMECGADVDGWGEVINQHIHENGTTWWDTSESVTPLYVATNGSHADLGRMLVLEWRADVNKTTESGKTPIYTAADRGDVELVRFLIQAGADVNLDTTHGGETPLFIAVYKGFTDIARLCLVEGKADVNKGRSSNGVCQTPLYAATYFEHPAMVRMLVVEFNADVDQMSSGEYTPLLVATIKNDAALARILLVEGHADPNKGRAPNNCAALHLAAHEGNTELTRMLVMGGARVNEERSEGRTPLHDAVFHAHRDTVFALCALGAKGLPLSKGQPPLVTSAPVDKPLEDWLHVVRGPLSGRGTKIQIRPPPYGSALKIALERRDHAAAIYLLHTQQTHRPTNKLVQEELVPIACTVGAYELARPVCGRTQRVAEVAVELYSNRWSTKVHALCVERQREAVMAVMIIMLRAQQSSSDEGTEAREQQGGLPTWMYGVVQDVWWKVLEMMGLWPH